MKEIIKEKQAAYYKQTPVKWRKIGDAIQDGAIALGAAVTLVASPPAWIPVVILVLGRIGKIITNFNTE
jgi:hypothetical protein